MNHPFENDRRRPRRGPQGRAVSARGQEPRRPCEVPAPREAQVPGEPPRVPEFKAPAALWRGITWQDVPGHDEPTQRLNFTLLRRGMLGGHKSCQGLEGEALKTELRRLSARNRGNSRQSHKRSGWRKPALPAPGKTDFSAAASAEEEATAAASAEAAVPSLDSASDSSSALSSGPSSASGKTGVRRRSSPRYPKPLPRL